MRLITLALAGLTLLGCATNPDTRPSSSLNDRNLEVIVKKDLPSDNPQEDCENNPNSIVHYKPDVPYQDDLSHLNNTRYAGKLGEILRKASKVNDNSMLTIVCNNGEVTQQVGVGYGSPFMINRNVSYKLDRNGKLLHVRLHPQDQDAVSVWYDNDMLDKIKVAGATVSFNQAGSVKFFEAASGEKYSLKGEKGLSKPLIEAQNLVNETLAYALPLLKEAGVGVGQIIYK